MSCRGDVGGQVRLASHGHGETTIGVDSNSKRDFIPDLPGDLFLLIALHLAPLDAVRCRRVSRSWRAAFDADAVCRRLIREHFPRCRELRVPSLCSSAVGPHFPPCSWSRVFAVVARRYHHLASARPRVVDKIEVAREPDFSSSSSQVQPSTPPSPPSPRPILLSSRPSDQGHDQSELPASFSFRGVEPWMRWLRWNDHLAPLQHRDAVWTMDDGLLVYPEVFPEEKDSSSKVGQQPMTSRGSRYVAYDLETGHRLSVPFDLADKTVRRVRLACGILIFEWCERESYHRLNTHETVHRHFATAFDIRKCGGATPSAAPTASSTSTSSNASSSSSSRCPKISSPIFPLSNAAPSPPTTTAPSQPRASILRSGPPTPDQTTWTVTFRSEWKLHFLGLPLNRHDRFFSTHTSTHYALYLWQPNRSPWGEDDPLEQLTVWDISFPSVYRPSQDPTGAHAPDPDLAPIVVRRFPWRELQHIGVRQRHTPSLRGLFLDKRNVYVHEEEHRWLVGSQANPSLPRHHHVRCVGFPFDGFGPRWVDECCADGDVHMSFCPRAGLVSGLSSSSSNSPPTTAENNHGERSIDTTESNMNHDHAEQQQRDETNGQSNNSNNDESNSDHNLPHERAAARRQVPPSQLVFPPSWPGYAPCWRHEEFPYLTVCEVTDAEAGVRFAARQCFMMETLSSFVVAPPLPPPPPPPPPPPEAPSPKTTTSNKKIAGGGVANGGVGLGGPEEGEEEEEDDDDNDDDDNHQNPAETMFEDHMWNKLVARGKLAGDERWLVGEDDQGRVTVARF